MRTALKLAFGGLLLAGAALAEGGNPEAGRKIANMCRTCHGVDGFAKIPIAPHIGGESVTYISTQLSAFRSGARKHEMMSVVAASLSDTQIADVSAWYAAQKAVATLSADPSGAPEACVGCHGEDGIALIDEAPNLAGETVIYIDTQLKAFRLGKRQSDIMSDVVADLTDEDFRAVANWYASIDLKIEASD